MVGGGLSYDVYVPESETPEHIRKACPGGTYYTQIHRDGKVYYEFAVATLSPEHEALPQGLERWESWKQHEAWAKKRELELARQVFPELRPLPTDKMPTLWINGLPIAETDAKKTVNA